MALQYPFFLARRVFLRQRVTIIRLTLLYSSIPWSPRGLVTYSCTKTWSRQSRHQVSHAFGRLSSQPPCRHCPVLRTRHRSTTKCYVARKGVCDRPLSVLVQPPDATCPVSFQDESWAGMPIIRGRPRNKRLGLAREVRRTALALCSAVLKAWGAAW